MYKYYQSMKKVDDLIFVDTRLSEKEIYSLKIQLTCETMKEYLDKNKKINKLNNIYRY